MELSLPQKTFTIIGDKDKLKQAFINIIQNAIEAIHHKHGQIQIKVQAKDSHILFLYIKDNGSGILDIHRPRLFELFFSTKDKGTGLGLSTVQKIIHAHGGHIQIRSEYSHGTSVEIELPLDLNEHQL